MNKHVVINNELAEPVIVGPEAYTSPAYARAESDRLWSKVWQFACRLEDIPSVGDYMTYDVVDDTVVIVRSEPDKIQAFFNVCQHRGRRLVDGCGNIKQFFCKYHAWRYNLKGENIHVLDKDDWGGALKQERLNLPEVKCDTWGGWVWINMDPNCVPLREFLEPAAAMLAPFQFEKMRYRWRYWRYFDCNWKTAMEAFMEPYHVEGTHPQLMKYADFYAWSQALGLHGNDGYEEREAAPKIESNTITRVGKGDPRISTAEMQDEIWRTVTTATTQTFVDAAARLVHELPEGTPADKVMDYFLKSARRMDAERGMVWPEISPDEMANAGLAWHIFPNLGILQGVTFAQGYRVRPHGSDPNKCIFESYALERFPEGQEPKTEWVYAPEDSQWPSVLIQDFSNMSQVQRGMRSRGFKGGRLNPKQERKVANLHRNLAKYMGTGAPQPLR